MKSSIVISALCAVLFLQGNSQAQSYPVKPIRIIVPYTAGGAADAAGRFAADAIAKGLKQSSFVENRVGAGTTIGAALVAGSPPDGYNILMAGVTGHIVSGILYKNLNYDPVKSFAPVAMLADAPFILAVNAESKAQTPRELIAASKAQPKGLTYGSSGVGAGPHLATELFVRATGANLVHVPYKGSAPAMQALLAGEVDLAILDLSAMNQIRAGKLRALAVTSATRSPLVPGVATMAETGVANVEVPSGQGLLMPVGVPREIVTRVNAVVNEALATEEVRKAFMARGFTPAPNTPEGFGAFLVAEYQKYADLTKRISITLE
jgi:tripartite-type tricarboxylate transporter receptor subunit TctC